MLEVVRISDFIEGRVFEEATRAVVSLHHLAVLVVDDKTLAVTCCSITPLVPAPAGERGSSSLTIRAKVSK